MMETEYSPLLRESPPSPNQTPAPVRIKVYTKRWYILGLYCCLVITQGLVWNNWGPVADSMKVAFGWSNLVLGLLLFWGPLTYAVSFYPWLLLLGRSLRLSILLGAGLILLGCVVKAVPFESNAAFTVACHACGIFNGLAGPLAMAAGPRLAAVWFPADQRVTAVALAATSQSMGPTLAFLVGPLIIPDVNRTLADGVSFNATVDLVSRRTFWFNAAEAALALCLLLLCLLHLPSRPPLPPSESSTVARQAAASGGRRLSLNCWIAIAAYGIPFGVNGAFNAAFDVNVSAFGVGQTEAGWIGFFSAAVGIVVGIAVSRIADNFRRPRMSLTNLTLLLLAGLAFAWLSLQCETVVPATAFSLYLGAIAANAALAATSPFFFEMASESAFPVGEELAAVAMTTVNNLFAGLFLAILFFPAAGTRWMNWVMTGSCLAALPLLIAFKEEFRRREVDFVEDDGGGVQAGEAAERRDVRQGRRYSEA